MRPEFGCAVHDCVFERIDADTLARIDQAVRVALDRWEPRIELEDVDFETRREGELLVHLRYRLRATNDVRNLVFPFYVVPAEEALVTLELRPLDDLRFQDLVTQARKRIALRCPEWDEHNVSDPGITLIEQFASMVEMLGYRIDRIPERLHVALLRLLDIELAPPVAATVKLEFRLAGPAAREVTIPAHDTEVTTTRRTGRGADRLPGRRDVRHPPAPPGRRRRAARRAHRQPARSAKACAGRPARTASAFGAHPAPGDGLYLGFAEPLDRLVLRISVDASKASGRRDRPEPAAAVLGGLGQAERRRSPAGAGRWAPARVLKDTTKGFNAGGGEIELQMPESTAAAQLAGERLALAALPPGGRRADGPAVPPAAADRLASRRTSSARWCPRSTPPAWRTRSSGSATERLPRPSTSVRLRR